jgi:hypothetical protein
LLGICDCHRPDATSGRPVRRTPAFSRYPAIVDRARCCVTGRALPALHEGPAVPSGARERVCPHAPSLGIGGTHLRGHAHGDLLSRCVPARRRSMGLRDALSADSELPDVTVIRPGRHAYTQGGGEHPPPDPLVGGAGGPRHTQISKGFPGQASPSRSCTGPLSPRAPLARFSLGSRTQT